MRWFYLATTKKAPFKIERSFLESSKLIFQRFLKAAKIKSRRQIHDYTLPKDGLPYNEKHVMGVFKLFKNAKLNSEIILKEGKDNRVTATFVNAGHILGSNQIIIRDEKYGTLRYTGDVGRVDQPQYLEPPQLYNSSFGPIHTLITESTYGGSNHPDRLTEQEQILDKIASTKGNVLIAAFGNNRHQDFQQFLTKAWDEGYYDLFAYSMIADGYTSRKFTNLFKHDNKYSLLKERDLVTWASGNSEQKREKLKSGNNIIITTSGMLSGGPVEIYLHEILSDKNALLILTGYQGEGTRGYKIAQEKTYQHNGQTLEVKCDLLHCKSWSSHADQEDLLNLVTHMNPKLTYLVHGNTTAQKTLQNLLVTEGVQKVLIPWEKGNKQRLGSL